MESIQNIFKIGFGPSSSHTMGPAIAATNFKNQYSDASRYEVTLFGSLAATGKGHLTDEALYQILGTKLTIFWEPSIVKDFHPNALAFRAFSDKDTLLAEQLVYSIGGGNIVYDSEKEIVKNMIYTKSSMNEILAWCKETGGAIWEYVEEVEGKGIWDYLEVVWSVMKQAIERGIENEEIIPGGLRLSRKASSYYVKSKSYKSTLKRKSMTYAYALAVAEENACGGRIVTAPTCGSSGVLPGVLYSLKMNYDYSDSKILRALATAGIIGNLVKFNASISGAEVGCQGEIGTACAMTAAAAAQIFGATPIQIEYAAEMAMEHHLGMTCDPIAGLVQIPCIERNAFAATRALDAATYALLSDGTHIVSFDKIIQVMKQTGHDLPSIYRETAEGGIAIFANKS
jgi:L-serine dehydratase